MKTEAYFEELKRQVDLNYAMANEARSLGLDPKTEVEIPLAMSMAEKVVGLISTVYPQMQGTGIADRILELNDFRDIIQILDFFYQLDIDEQNEIFQSIDKANLLERLKYSTEIFSIKRYVACCSGESSLNHSSYFSEARTPSSGPKDSRFVMVYFSFPSLLPSSRFDTVQ